MPDLPKAAMWYARHGWHVFPCWPNSKTPMTRHGVDDATTDEAQVREWWRRTPRANIAIHCGASGILALDLDQYKDTYTGTPFLNRDDEETVTNLTGGGGTHLLYATPDRYTNQRGDLPEGIDVRAWKGYIIVPPSIHPTTRRAYQWEVGYAPNERELLPLPLGLATILQSARFRQRTVGVPSSAAVSEGVKGVETLIDALGLDVFPPIEYDNGGRKWILRTCPFQPTGEPHAKDRGTFILVAKDGHTAAGCQHARCQHRLKMLHQTGWTYLWNLVYGRVAA